MKIFVTGVGGQLGHDVVNELISRGHIAVGSDIAPEYAGVADGSAVTRAEYRQLDIMDAKAVEKVLMDVKPDAVIHCAAWTAVDLAEDLDKQEKVRAINACGTENIAHMCKALDCKMTYISTDYVFDGQGTEPCRFVLWVMYAITGGISIKGFKLLDNRVAAFLSDISMEIYLCHMVMFRVIEKVHLEKYIGNAHLLYWTYCILGIGLAFLFSWIVTKTLFPRCGMIINRIRCQQ